MQTGPREWGGQALSQSTLRSTNSLREINANPFQGWCPGDLIISHWAPPPRDSLSTAPLWGPSFPHMNLQDRRRPYPARSTNLAQNAATVFHLAMARPYLLLVAFYRLSAHHPWLECILLRCTENLHLLLGLKASGWQTGGSARGRS